MVYGLLYAFQIRRRAVYIELKYIFIICEYYQALKTALLKNRIISLTCTMTNCKWR